MILLLAAENVTDQELAAGYMSRRFRSQGWHWLDPMLGREDLSPRQRASLLLLTDEYPKAWERAADLGAEVEAMFWKAFRIVGLGDFKHVDLVAAKLLEARRPRRALDFMVLYGREDSGQRSELLAQGLERLLEHPAEGPDLNQLSDHVFREVFARLEISALSRDRLARLEWAFLQVFETHDSPPTLSRHLAEQPALFVDVVCRVYRPHPPTASGDDSEEEIEPEPDEQRQAIAGNAYRLLSDWNVLPGSRTDGSLNAAALNAWVNDARARLAEARRLEVGEGHIGRVLFSSRADPDGAWPPQAVRDLLERMQSSHVEEGLRTQIFNSRGVTRRDPLEGGEQERAIAEKYRAQAAEFADRWPRTAAIFSDLAETYELWARRHDEEAERRRRGLGR